MDPTDAGRAPEPRDPEPPGGAADPHVAAIRVLLGVIVAILMIAGMREAQSVIVPFLVALFASMLAAPVVLWLQGRGMPAGVAVLLVVVVLGGFGTLIGFVLAGSIDSFTERLPVYTARLNAKLEAIVPQNTGSRLMPSWDDLSGYIKPGQAFGMVGTVLGGLRGVMTNTFLIILLMVFMLLDVTGSLDRIRKISGESQGPINYITAVAAGMKRYFVIKTVVSLVTGTVAGVLVYSLGVDFAVLWGLVAFLFNFIPNIGSIIAAVPPVVLAFIQFGPGRALGLALGYVAINVIMGNLIEPRITGRGLGLTTLTVFLSLLFWGWVLGPVGMLLSVPLTMAIKLGFEASPRMRWIAILMGSTS